MNSLCPLCLIEESMVLYEKLVWNKYSIKINKCNNCDFIYKNTSMNNIELNEFIFEEYYKSKDVGSEINKRFIRHFKRRAKLHKKLLSSYFDEDFCGRVLDVGCGAGLFLNEMRKLGWETFGIEPSRECYEYATDNLNLNVFRGLFNDYPVYKKFDLIYFSHVFDDLPNILNVLEKVKDLLEDNGKIFIEVPNFNGYKNFNSIKLGDLIENSYYFTPLSLKNLKDTNGFDINFLETYQAIYLNTISQYLQAPFSFLKGLIIPFDNKEHIRIIASIDTSNL